MRRDFAIPPLDLRWVILTGSSTYLPRVGIFLIDSDGF